MGNSESSSEEDTSRKEQEEKYRIMREQNRLENANRKLQRELELEKARLEKNEKMELAKMELRKQEMEEFYKLRTLSKKQDGEETVQQFEMVAVLKMVELGFDPFDINIILTGLSRTLHDDKTVPDKTFMENVLRNKMNIHQHQAILPSRNSRATTSTSNSVTLVRRKVEDDFNALMNYLLSTD